MPRKHLDKIELIKAVQKRRAIWNMKCINYYNRSKVQTAWQEVSQEIKQPVEECRKKWRSIRDIFTKEIRRQQVGKKSLWFYLKHLEFLVNMYGKPCTLLNRDTQEKSNDIHTENNEMAEEENSNDMIDIEDNEVTEVENATEKEEVEETTEKEEVEEETDVEEVEEVTEMEEVEEEFEDNKSLLRDIISTDHEEDNNWTAVSSAVPPEQYPQHQFEEVDDDYHFLMSVLPSMRSISPRKKNIIRLKILEMLCKEMD